MGLVSPEQGDPLALRQQLNERPRVRILKEDVRTGKVVAEVTFQIRPEVGDPALVFDRGSAQNAPEHLEPEPTLLIDVGPNTLVRSLENLL